MCSIGQAVVGYDVVLHQRVRWHWLGLVACGRLLALSDLPTPLTSFPSLSIFTKLPRRSLAAGPVGESAPSSSALLGSVGAAPLAVTHAGEVLTDVGQKGSAV